MGHRDIETTLGTYSHVLPEVFDGAAAAIERIYAGISDAEPKTALNPLGSNG